MAEEVGVEPTRHLIGASLVLKTRRPTGDVALPLLLFTGYSPRRVYAVLPNQ